MYAHNHIIIVRRLRPTTLTPYYYNMTLMTEYDHSKDIVVF